MPGRNVAQKSKEKLRKRKASNIRISLIGRLNFVFWFWIVSWLLTPNITERLFTFAFFVVGVFFFASAWKNSYKDELLIIYPYIGAVLDIIFIATMPITWYFSLGGFDHPPILMMKLPTIFFALIILIINSFTLEKNIVLTYTAGFVIPYIGYYIYCINHPTTVIVSDLSRHALTNQYDPIIFYSTVNGFIITAIVIVIKLRRDERLLEEFVGYETELFDAIRERDEAFDQIDNAYIETIDRITKLTEFRDNETGEHIGRTREYVRVLCQEMDIPQEDINSMYYAAPMHDVGKVAIPDNILHKNGSLTAEEWDVMKSHSVIGGNAFEGSDSPIINTAHHIALHHHEKYNGKGYPGGISGSAIPLAARVMAVADVYDALRSERPYKKGFTHEEAMDIILNGDGRTSPEDFDPDVLRALESVADQFELIFQTSMV